MQSIWDNEDEFERADREMHRFLDEEREAKRLRWPRPIKPEEKVKTHYCLIKGDGGFSCRLPTYWSNRSKLLAVEYPFIQDKNMYVPLDCMSITDGQLIFIEHRPQTEELIRLTYSI